MVTNILRRGGAWRIAALVILAASILSFGAGRPTTVSAHDGDGWCDVWNTPVAQYLGQWTDWGLYPSPHYHEWNTIGGFYRHTCYYIA